MSRMSRDNKYCFNLYPAAQVQLKTYTRPIPHALYILDCREAKTVKVQSHSKKPVHFFNWFLQHMQTR